MVGETASLHARAVGNPAPKMTWQKDGVQITSDSDHVIQTSEGSSAIFFPQTVISDSAWYQCVATNSAGSTSTRAKLYIESMLFPHLNEVTMIVYDRNNE